MTKGSRNTLRSASTLDCRAHRPALERLCRRLPAARSHPDERYLRAARLAGDELPLALRTALENFRRYGNPDGCLHLTGLVPAPLSQATHCLALLAGRLGDLVGYAQERGGALFHDIRPVRREARRQAAGSSAIELELHTERCFHPFLPAHVLLACMRPDAESRASTLVVGAPRLLPLLPRRILPVLRSRDFRTGIDYSFGGEDIRRAARPRIAVLYGSTTDPFLRCDLDLMEGLNGRAQAALEKLASLAREIARPVVLAAGDVLVIDNRRALHGRSAFTATYDGRDRWLRRAYVVADLAAAAADLHAGGRVIHTQF